MSQQAPAVDPPVSQLWSREVRRLVDHAAISSLPVLIEGETGTGKSYLARWIHQTGALAAQPFVAVDCAAVPASLFEAELFGNEQGAYTDARSRRRGLAEMASGGSLFLDEISEIPLAQQAKLLTLVEEARIRRLGSTEWHDLDVRILCATNRDLDRLMAAGTFRHDLYYRCCGIRIRLPPLRHRRAAIPALVRRLLAPASAPREGLGDASAVAISAEALAVLRSYRWPGNVRQLKHVVELARLSAGGNRLEAHHLPVELLEEAATPGSPGPDGQGPSGGRRPRYSAPSDPRQERVNIRSALESASGNRTRAAELLGMSRQVLWERIRYYRLDDEASEGRKDGVRTASGHGRSAR